ncbi:hypothetical protein LPW11_18045 [Geomonas sp. RF6]|uniref:PQ-loop domain-containing transporter n=1 Tax=Geomonas sp. RF6 TaxID=2897342 RepID=UPI001E4ED069|nr:PQ-loop domain-containing transporter [Geomonas sp. RF6]UFS69780.1 hypothetical protein LPW11_18045 [Geomonas sp. RF6]
MSQQFLFTLKSLYAANGFLAVLLYLPQIIRAWKDKEQAGSLSVVTFGGWTVGSFITALYAWYFVRDPLFTFISAGNTAGSGAVFLLIVHSRLSAWRLLFFSRCLPLLCKIRYRQGTKRTALRVSLSTSLNDSTT